MLAAVFIRIVAGVHILTVIEDISGRAPAHIDQMFQSVAILSNQAVKIQKLSFDDYRNNLVGQLTSLDQY